jgi:hypothetical protein
MVKQANMIIRKTCKLYGVPLWALAQHIGISEVTLIRRMRTEFSEERKKELLDTIKSISVAAEESFSDIYGGE